MKAPTLGARARRPHHQSMHWRTNEYIIYKNMTISWSMCHFAIPRRDGFRSNQQCNSLVFRYGD